MKKYSRAFIDETHLNKLGTTEELPWKDKESYIYKHSSMSWEEFWNKGENKIVETEAGKIRYCTHDYGWEDVGENQLVDAFKTRFPTF